MTAPPRLLGLCCALDSCPMRAVVVVALVALLSAGCSTSQEDLYGRELYEHSCAVCHGVDGSGGIGFDIGPGSNAALNLTDAQIAGVIEVGPGNMPAFSRLTPEQVRSLVQYVRTLEE
jgi:mono/diheme cytochrome c family protein